MGARTLLQMAAERPICGQCGEPVESAIVHTDGDGLARPGGVDQELVPCGHFGVAVPRYPGQRYSYPVIAVTGAVTCTEIHWGVRYTSSIGGSHITDYETDEDGARRAFKQAVQPGGRHELLRRTVRVGEWQHMEERSRS